MHKTTESPSFSASCRIEGNNPLFNLAKKITNEIMNPWYFIAINSLPTSVLCKQFGPRSGPIDTLIIYLKVLLKTLILKKNQQTIKTHAILPSRHRL